MEHIMKGILLWEPLYLTGLQVSAKDHYEYILKNRERPYEPMDMYYFLNPEQVKQFDLLFNIMFGKSNFFQIFTNFIEVLKNTIIGNDILAVVPFDMSHCICVAKDNIYGVEFHKDEPTNFESSVSLTVYCENFLSNTDNISSFEGQWKYRVEKFLYQDFEIYLFETEKETLRGPTNIFGPKIENGRIVGYYNKTSGERTNFRLLSTYADDDANYQLFANDVKFAELEYTFKDFSGSFEQFEYLENLCLLKSFKNANRLYLIFCKGLANFGVTSESITHITAVVYNTEYCTFDEDFNEDECCNYINSAVAYSSGILECVQFNDNDGGHWRIQKDYWSFCNDSIEVISYDGDIEYYISKIIEDSDNDDTLKRNISCSYTKKMIDNFLFNTIKTAKTIHVPKYFPKE